MKAKEIFRIVNELEIPAELSKNKVKYIEEFDGDPYLTASLVLARNNQLKAVGLQISNPKLTPSTAEGIITTL
jgi:hypothetical protein